MSNIIKIDDSKYNNLLIFGSEILNKVLPAKLLNFDYKKCTNESNNNFINSDFIKINSNITNFINQSADLLLENGFKINKNNFHVDFHRYYINNEKYETDLTWHTDDKGATPYNVNTVIFYLRKDHSLKGGNLLYKENTNTRKININKNNIVLMRGDLIHKPEDIDGYGRRESIVVQFERI